MYEINFNTLKNEVTNGINFYGTVFINDIRKDVICTVTYEFLEDINNGSSQYMETFNNNLFLIEQIADDKLNLFLEEEVENNTIRIKIVSEDRYSYNL